MSTLSLSSLSQAEEIVIVFLDGPRRADPPCDMGAIVASLPLCRALKVFKVNLRSHHGLDNVGWDEMDVALSRDPRFQMLELDVTHIDMQGRDSFEKTVFPILRTEGRIKWKQN